MSRKIYSLERFTGTDGKRRINCAQAIASAYHEDSAPLDPKVLKSFKKCGHGKAPGKLCGAYYAAEYLVQKSKPELIPELKEFFYKEAGSLICREIRKSKSLSCEGCVEYAAEFMSRTFPPGDKEKKPAV